MANASIHIITVEGGFEDVLNFKAHCIIGEEEGAALDFTSIYDVPPGIYRNEDPAIKHQAEKLVAAGITSLTPCEVHTASAEVIACLVSKEKTGYYTHVDWLIEQYGLGVSRWDCRIMQESAGFLKFEFSVRRSTFFGFIEHLVDRFRNLRFSIQLLDEMYNWAYTGLGLDGLCTWHRYLPDVYAWDLDRCMVRPAVEKVSSFDPELETPLPRDQSILLEYLEKQCENTAVLKSAIQALIWGKQLDQLAKEDAIIKNDLLLWDQLLSLAPVTSEAVAAHLFVLAGNVVKIISHASQSYRVGGRQNALDLQVDWRMPDNRLLVVTIRFCYKYKGERVQISNVTVLDPEAAILIMSKLGELDRDRAVKRLSELDGYEMSARFPIPVGLARPTLTEDQQQSLEHWASSRSYREDLPLCDLADYPDEDEATLDDSMAEGGISELEQSLTLESLEQFDADYRKSVHCSIRSIGLCAPIGSPLCAFAEAYTEARVEGGFCEALQCEGATLESRGELVERLASIVAVDRVAVHYKSIAQYDHSAPPMTLFGYEDVSIDNSSRVPREALVIICCVRRGEQRLEAATCTVLFHARHGKWHIHSVD